VLNTLFYIVLDIGLRLDNLNYDYPLFDILFNMSVSNLALCI